MDEPVFDVWLRRSGTSGQFHRFRGAALISCCGMLRIEQQMESPDSFPQYFCRRCVDIKAKDNARERHA